MPALLENIAGLIWLIQVRWRGLLRVSVLWFALAVLFNLAAGPLGAVMVPGQVNAQAVILSFMALMALLSGWFSVHRYLMRPDEGARWLPNGPQFQFVGVQVGVMTGLVVLVSTVLSPVLAVVQLQGFQGMTLTEDIKPPLLPGWFFPLFVALCLLIFTRLLLLAPMSARGEGKAIRRSWSATRGHMLRLLVLQVLVLLPSALALWVESALPVRVLAVPLAAALEFLSLWLLAALAEAEYARLAAG